MKKVVGILLILSAYNISASDVLALKYGVKFDHKGHQTEKAGNCTVCHDESVGKIPGFGKEWAHKRCILCHDLLSDGRNTKCGACHLTMGFLKP
jgi:Cytochrome c7 and related cytochrome c